MLRRPTEQAPMPRVPVSPSATVAARRLAVRSADTLRDECRDHGLFVWVGIQGVPLVSHDAFWFPMTACIVIVGIRFVGDPRHLVWVRNVHELQSEAKSSVARPHRDSVAGPVVVEVVPHLIELGPQPFEEPPVCFAVLIERVHRPAHEIGLCFGVPGDGSSARRVRSSEG